MCVKGSVENSLVCRLRSQMSWVQIPAVTLRQARTFIDSGALSVQWNSSCLKLWGPIMMRLPEKQDFTDGLYSLY